MKCAAPMQKEIPKTAVTICGRAVQNPLQLKRESEKVLMQKKKNPLQMQSANCADTNSNNPLQVKKNNTSLPDNLKAGVEVLSGYNMDDIKVHYNSSKPTQLRAYAYAQGTDIHIAPGQEKHLPHEAWHVVQQKQGRVKATIQMKSGVTVNNDKGLEKEADRMGEKAALSAGSVKRLVEKKSVRPVGAAVIQMSSWRWSEAQQIWIHISGSQSDPPPYPGNFEGETDKDEETKGKSQDKTFGGQRIIGDSNQLAKNRYNLKIKKHNFKTWKKEREAQHLIPASLAKKFKSLENIIDNSDNGMMLPAKHKAANAKVTHRRPKYRDHRPYTKNVERLIGDVLKTGLKNNQTTMQMIMKVLRPVNRLKSYKYLDNILYSEFKNSWNATYGTTHSKI